MGLEVAWVVGVTAWDWKGDGATVVTVLGWLGGGVSYGFWVERRGVSVFGGVGYGIGKGKEDLKEAGVWFGFGAEKGGGSRLGGGVGWGSQFWWRKGNGSVWWCGGRWNGGGLGIGVGEGARGERRGNGLVGRWVVEEVL
ncbi:uncharacterized protein G2W53_026529 [Senna tora]|uniref:Uncharacterized protein n=1 Tax=Senna tora TaxID=362788 RepID=A0A834WLB9_9FABA|nr:uncharacterized protein G2W53_026529 [Senna tora]